MDVSVGMSRLESLYSCEKVPARTVQGSLPIRPFASEFVSGARRDEQALGSAVMTDKI